MWVWWDFLIPIQSYTSPVIEIFRLAQYDFIVKGSPFSRILPKLSESLRKRESNPSWRLNNAELMWVWWDSNPRPIA